MTRLYATKSPRGKYTTIGQTEDEAWWELELANVAGLSKLRWDYIQAGWIVVPVSVTELKEGE